jgi:hypothetical protein
MPPDVTVPLRHLLDMDITFEAVPRFATPRGQRMLLAARSGRFEGPGLARSCAPTRATTSGSRSPGGPSSVSTPRGSSPVSG